MNNKHFKIWTIATLSVAVLCIIIRSAWQIAVIPTADTIVIFLPLIVALIGGTALFIYVAIKPERMRNLFFLIIITIAVSGGMVAGVIHYTNFITSPDAEPVLSKVISTCFLLAGLSAYFLILCFLWSLLKTKERHG